MKSYLIKKNQKIYHTGLILDKFNFVYVGNSQWRKGLDLLINAWHKCFKSYDNARLIIKDNPAIYGKNSVLNEIVKMQYKTGCAPVTYIDDNVSDETMADIFKASKVVVHPYRAEGFGMHIQEAVACGCVPILPDTVLIKILFQKKLVLEFKQIKKLLTYLHRKYSLKNQETHLL